MLHPRIGKKTSLDTVRFLEYPDFLAGINSVKNLFFFLAKPGEIHLEKSKTKTRWRMFPSEFLFCFLT